MPTYLKRETSPLTGEGRGKAYQDLTTRHGYAADDISVVMSDETRTRHFGNVKPGQEFKEGSKAAEGAGYGGGIGLGVGAAVGALVAAASAIAIPGLGLVVAGPIAGAIAGAGAGGATGTLVGALVGAGIPENRAAEYERGLKDGGIALGTRARDEPMPRSWRTTFRATVRGTFCASHLEANLRMTVWRRFAAFQRRRHDRHLFESQRDRRSVRPL